MHNRLIFRYHHARARSEPLSLRGCLLLREWYEPTHSEEESNAGTQEGR